MKVFMLQDSKVIVLDDLWKSFSVKVSVSSPLIKCVQYAAVKTKEVTPVFPMHKFSISNLYIDYLALTKR